MISTPYAMFGTIALLVRMSPEEVREVTLGDNGLVTSGLYYYTDGLAKVKVKETGEELKDRTPGWLNSEHSSESATTSGTLQLTFPTETEWLCIPHEHNTQGLPDCTAIVIGANSTAEVKNNSNLFLVRGTVIVNEREFIGPWQIRIRTGDTVVQNTSDATAYLLHVRNKHLKNK